jgi:glucose/arabinose dehydrogenase
MKSGDRGGVDSTPNTNAMQSMVGRSRRSPFAAVVLAALWLGVLLGPAVGPVSGPAPVEAAGPNACQKGLFQKEAPKHEASCSPATGGRTGTGSDPLVAVGSVPAGFTESVVWSGLLNPTEIRFAADGRVFVAEKSGTIKVFANLTDTTPTVFSDLVPAVHNFWDRGLLGLALDPKIANGTGGTGDYVYVLYAYDHVLGSASPAPRWGDTCPSPPGATSDGCVISGRLSRFPVSGTTISGPEQVLIEDWCQQFPSHSVGNLAFGPDGSLYVSAGDGASFTTVDYGEFGGGAHPTVETINPCGDPPGGKMTTTISEGGALRSQDVRTNAVYKSYPTVVTQDSPLAYWRLGEASGTTAADVTAGHNGTYVGSPTRGVASALLNDANTAVTLNGTSQAVTVADSSAFQFAGTAPFSVEAWFKHTPDGNARRIISAEDASGFGWSLWSDSGHWGFTRSSVDGSDSVSTSAPAGSAWVHVVASYDPTAACITNGPLGCMRLYQNGLEVPAAKASILSLPSDTTFAIGRSFGPTGLFFNGSLDEVSVYSSALSGSLASAHYVAGIKTGGDPTGLDGAVLRVNPATGAAMPGNPFSSSSDLNARRIIAYGFRNPFRFTIRPGTSELWVADVGWDTWEEINRIPSGTDATAENFGWPCYEGASTTTYTASGLNLCTSLTAGNVAAPYFTYNHHSSVASGDGCPTGSSSLTGIAFYPESGGSYPAGYGGGVFFGDHSRNCIWYMPKGTNGLPDPSGVQKFVSPAANPVDIEIGPGYTNNDLFYVDFEGGTIRRVSVTGANQPPTAVIDAQPTSGSAPLTVDFDASGSIDPEGTPLTFAWDLDGDGQYDDATGVQVQHQYSTPGNVTVGLRVTDAGLASTTASQVIMVGNDPPQPVIDTPSASLTYAVNDPISFSGHATDTQDGALPASALTWTVIIHHCPSNCHTHTIETRPGVASGSFNAPDHDYPSYLELVLTATDSNGASASTSVVLQPKTVNLTFQTAVSGLSLAVGPLSQKAPFTRTVIIGSANAVTATSPQTLNGTTYAYKSWSDGQGMSHVIVAPATNTTYTATYAAAITVSFAPVADAYVRSDHPSTNYGANHNLIVLSNVGRTYLKFTVTGLTGPAHGVRLRLWVTDSSNVAGSCFKLSNTSWSESRITWNNRPGITVAALARVGTANARTWVEFNLGAGAIPGNGTYTFVIASGSTNEVVWASRETGARPALLVTR